jgi:hypothetical protein
MTCKGIYIRHEAVKPPAGYRYPNGRKRCIVCDLFIEWDGVGNFRFENLKMPITHRVWHLFTTCACLISQNSM